MNNRLREAIEKAVIIPEGQELAVVGETDHIFSDKFFKRSAKLIKRQKKPYYPLICTSARGVACIIAAFFVISFTTVMSVEALRKPFFEFITRIFTNHSSITVDSGSDSSVPNTIEHKYEITVDLSDYRIVYSYSNSAEIYNEYANGKTVISFAQSIIGDFNKNYNTENAVIENIYINGYDATAFLDNRGYYTLIWNNGEYVFELSSNIGKDELISIAKSVQKVE